MNELDTLRTAFPEQPAPSPETVTDARRQLSRELSGTTGGRLRGYRLGTVLTAGAAAALAAVLAVPLLSPDPQPQGAGPQPGAPASEPVTTRQVLLAAAAQQEREPASGKYYRISTLSIVPWITIGSGPSAYKLAERRIHETWTAGPDSERSWVGNRSLGALPATAADRAKWQRAGSPTRWNLGPADTVDRHDQIVTTRPEPGRLDPIQGENRYYVLGDREGLTAAQIQALPTDPAGLRAYLLQRKPADVVQEPDRWLFSVSGQLLSTTPAPPAVRAAALRLVADLPDVRSRTGVRDELGRSGTEITLVEQRSSGSETYRLLIDPRTGRLLSNGYVGRFDGRIAKQGKGLVIFSGWTDDTPRTPSATVR